MHTITEEQLRMFSRQMEAEEKSALTREKYLRDTRRFAQWLAGRPLTRENLLTYKQMLSQDYALTSANSMIAAVNAFLRFLQREELVIRQFRLQKTIWCSEARELTRADYQKLVSAARIAGKERLALVIQTVCVTGIRISELPFLTVEAARRGETSVRCKGKQRSVFLVPALRKELLAYAKRQGIRSGMLFVTRRGRPLDRSNIWREMKLLCLQAGVNPEKVFPHNLRHLFARTFYAMDRDIVKLADILGHSSINTTRIYTVSTGSEHRRKMEQMRLLV
ncbi:MAG: tyrosine-type recombinase/integrase [Oscillospiraceae bacterium]|nr:tyrosine-type recombinase/integrase [Oscillospiraceae bacterium]